MTRHSPSRVRWIHAALAVLAWCCLFTSAQAADESERRRELDAYTNTGADGERHERFIHFDALLVKKGGWKILMEYQRGPATREDWDRLPAPPTLASPRGNPQP